MLDEIARRSWAEIPDENAGSSRIVKSGIPLDEKEHDAWLKVQGRLDADDKRPRPLAQSAPRQTRREADPRPAPILIRTLSPDPSLDVRIPIPSMVSGHLRYPHWQERSSPRYDFRDVPQSRIPPSDTICAGTLLVEGSIDAELRRYEPVCSEHLIHLGDLARTASSPPSIRQGQGAFYPNSKSTSRSICASSAWSSRQSGSRRTLSSR